MVDQKEIEAQWTDFEPDELIPETDVPNQVDNLTRLVDDWINDNSRYFDPFKWEDTNEQYWRKKAFLEVGGYLLNAHGTGIRDIPLPDVHQLVIQRVNDRRYAHMMLRSPRKFHHFALPLIYTKYVDSLEAETEVALKQTVELGAYWNVEQLQFRHLEFRLLTRIISEEFGFVEKKYDYDTILEYSLLNNQPNIIRSTLRDAYCLTHDVMFYNNIYGVANDSFPDEPAPYDITDLLRGLILRYMAEDNCDIVLELVASGVLQRQISKQMVRFVLSWVLEKTEKHGYVPAPDIKETETLLSRNSNESKNKVKDDGNAVRWNYKSEQEETWGENFHANIVAGMTARIIKRDWNKLDSLAGEHSLIDQSFRRDLARVGQMVKSLAEYDLKTGAQQMEELAKSPVMTKYDSIFEEAVVFLKDQRTVNDKFGYWTKEEILYTNAGKSSESFYDDLVTPISESCQNALNIIDNNELS